MWRADSSMIIRMEITKNNDYILDRYSNEQLSKCKNLNPSTTENMNIPIDSGSFHPFTV